MIDTVRSTHDQTPRYFAEAIHADHVEHIEHIEDQVEEEGQEREKEIGRACSPVVAVYWQNGQVLGNRCCRDPTACQEYLWVT